MNRPTPSGVPGVDPTDRRILVVDDEASIRDAIGKFLRARGFDVIATDSAAVALEHLRATRFGAMLCDVRMPGMTGLELLPEARRLDPDLAVLMLTGLNDATTATEAIAGGATDYLLKPIELDHLEDAVSGALRRRRDRIEQRDVAGLVREEVSLRTAELEREKLALRGLSVSVLETVVTLFEARDAHRAGHSLRVGALGRDIARALRLDSETIGHVHVAGRLHDIGKIALPDSLLARAGALTPGDDAELRTHVAIGVQLLTPLKHLSPALPYVRDHHERWDGSGYPAGLQGAAISIGGRILAAADAFVVSTAGSAYSPPMPAADALARLAQVAGVQLDPEVVGALQQVARAPAGSAP